MNILGFLKSSSEVQPVSPKNKNTMGEELLIMNYKLTDERD